MLRKIVFAGALALGLSGASADSPKDFDSLLAPLSHGDCVAMTDVRAVGSVVQLTGDQFQFVRAFYMAIPPLSHELPVGDKAFYAKDSTGTGSFGLYDEAGSVCAVFVSTDWLQKLIGEVGRGEVGKRGDPT